MDEQSKDREKVLSDEILADARRRAGRTVGRARSEAQKVVEQAVAEARAAGDAALGDVERRLERQRQVFDASLLLEGRMRRLVVQGKLLDETFDRAFERLRSREGFDYARVVRELAVDAVLAMSGDAFVLGLDKDDLALVGATLPGEVAAAVRERSGRAVTVTVSERAGRFEGGVVVESADGRRRLDNSFAGRLRRLRDELRFDVADLLFGREGKDGTP